MHEPLKKNPLLSPKAVAEMLGCSRKTVERAFAHGKFPGAFQAGRLISIPESDVEAYKVRPKATKRAPDHE